MKTQKELEEKLEELVISLKILNQKKIKTKAEKLEKDFLKYHINFILWTLNIPRSYFKDNK